MADLKAKFVKASEDVQKLPKKPDTDVLLKLYALFKQGSEGDTTGERPGIMNISNRFKYDAWMELKGKSKDDAMKEYIAFVESLKAKAKG